MIQELIKLENCQSPKTSLCRNCEFCIVFDGIRECEYDRFNPVDVKKSMLYTPIEFDCLDYIKREN
jgi:hypothetical protein